MIATDSVVLSGMVIGKESLIGAGAVVAKNVLLQKIVVGNLVRDIGNTDKIRDKVTGELVYPWKFS